MPWDPEKYNQFKDIRFQPFFDLVNMISAEGLNHGIDIGCGTGEQTKILADRFERAKFLGVDPSPEMLAKSSGLENDRLEFRTATVEEFIRSNRHGKWDLVFSNAALQWSDHHERLFTDLISLINMGGQLAIQMPVQKENRLNQILLELVQEKPFVDYLNNWKRESPLLSIDEYAQSMFDNGMKDIQIIQKVYPIIADSEEKLFDFISGSALIPYLERLSETQQRSFTVEFRKRIQKTYKQFPAIYAFKRLLLYGKKL